MSAARRSPKAAAVAERVLANGPPRRLAFDLPPGALATADAGAIKATLKGATISRVSLSTRGQDRGRPPRIKVRVDPLTPPGRYEGTATIGTTTIPIVADVQPTNRVRTTPTMIEVSPAPGETVEVTLTLLNLSNVGTDVPAQASFPLLDRSGFGDAFYHAIGEDPPEGKQRIDVLLDDLAATHGGVVTAHAVKDSPGPIAPGQSAAITLALTFPKQLRPGAEYAGSWNIDATHVPVRVKVPGGEPVAPAPVATEGTAQPTAPIAAKAPTRTKAPTAAKPKPPTKSTPRKEPS
ncbi:MAG: hypothetical protein JHD16_10440 [Solirubrobacteraceae bacterium]|nr:hypothetical protein [Solirubrobacteraceae bacterium]